SITTYTPLPPGKLNQQYSQIIQADGGKAPYTWQFISGNLPNGLTLKSNGELSGTPTQVGTFTFTIKVNDSSNPVKTATKEFTLVIKNASMPSNSGAITLKNGKDGYSENSMRLLFSRYPNDNYKRILWAGRIGEYAGINRLILRFNLTNAFSQIPANASIVSAKLRLYQYRYKNYNASGQIISLFSLKTAFDPNTVCWNSSWSKPGTGENDIEPNPLSSVTLDDKVNVWREWNITSYVKEVHNGQRQNLGFLLKASDESIKGLHSRYKMDNDPDQDLRPELVIEYVY
ncbi:MAG: hypothetical protein DRP14_01980, partial [Candidatus Aenigmatarchaeota archaeon]